MPTKYSVSNQIFISLIFHEYCFYHRTVIAITGTVKNDYHNWCWTIYYFLHVSCNRVEFLDLYFTCLAQFFFLIILISEGYFGTHEAFKESLKVCKNVLAAVYGVEDLGLWWLLENLKLRFWNIMKHWSFPNPVNKCD
jgi:hypothetical protein